MIRHFWRWVRVVVRRRHPLEGRRLALVLLPTAEPGAGNRDEPGGDAMPAVDDPGTEADGALLRGLVRHDGRRLVLDWGEGRLPLDEGWLAEARPAPPDLRDLLGDAEFWVPVPVEPLPEGMDAVRLEDTGLAWPGSPAAEEMDERGREPMDARDEATEKAVARIEAVHRRFLDYLRRYDEERDGRAMCTCMFTLFQERLGHEVADGGFDDPEWVAALCEAFAERYFVAMDDIDAAVTAATRFDLEDRLRRCGCRAWAEVYRALHQEKCFATEAIFFPLLVHVGYDLPMALAEVGLEASRSSRLGDFHRINDALAGYIDEVQDRVSERYCRRLGLLDRLAGDLDERVTNYAFRVTRAAAWYNAARLLEPSLAEEARRSLEGMPRDLIERVRRPPERTTRVLSRVVRRLLPTRRRWPAAGSPLAASD